ncbi:hypothetical protein Ancab_009302 [Ancistrocladus abbreviatus]
MNAHINEAPTMMMKIVAYREKPHALDVSVLTATQELQRVKQELAMTTDAKNQAPNRADDATNIAEKCDADGAGTDVDADAGSTLNRVAQSRRSMAWAWAWAWMTWGACGHSLQCSCIRIEEENSVQVSDFESTS